MVCRVGSALASALVLASCAATGPAPVGAGGPRRPVAAAPSARLDPAAALLRPGAADATTIAEARAMFGPPDVDRRDGVGALQVWTLPTCALTLGFANDRLRTVEPGPRRTGAPAPSLQTCIAEARARAAAS
ncbi:MAG: hypothetical protein NW200_12290 [Hyphomonadaceae bacterium]|nr:hypothetical protein [Hyphomonadaceae bacterium]